MKAHIIWFVVAVAALVAGTQFAQREVQVVEKPIQVVKTKEVFVDRPVEVIKEVPKEVVRIVERKVEVPAEVPAKYQDALEYSEKLQAAKFVSGTEELANIHAVKVVIFLNDAVKKIVSEDDIRTKFELTLRRSGVRIDTTSSFTLNYAQEGMENDAALVYSCHAKLSEFGFGRRDNGKMIMHIADTWRVGNYGTVGLARAKDSLLAQAERTAERFANEWLAQNPAK